MKIVSVAVRTGLQFQIVCACGWVSAPCHTLEAVGRLADLHMAEKFPLPTERRPCSPPNLGPYVCDHDYCDIEECACSCHSGVFQ